MAKRRKHAEAMVPVPKRYEEWAFEYRVGYNDGLTVKPYTYGPAMYGSYHYERKRAYRAGRTAAVRASRRARPPTPEGGGT